MGLDIWVCDTVNDCAKTHGKFEGQHGVDKMRWANTDSFVYFLTKQIFTEYLLFAKYYTRYIFTECFQGMLAHKAWKCKDHHDTDTHVPGTGCGGL